jgi:hypothetical protein
MTADLPSVSLISIFINALTPPLVRMAVRTHSVKPSDARSRLFSTTVAPLSCALSHWPPFRNPNQRVDQMKEFQTFRKPVLEQYPNLLVEYDKCKMEMAKKNQYPLITPSC